MDNNKFNRIAQRRGSSEIALYKVLDRNKFYARHYTGIKNPMTLIDVSTTGCAFRTDANLTPGAYLEVEFRRLSEDHVFDTPIIASCETVYCLPVNHSGNRIGAKFLNIERNDVEKIRHFSEKPI